MTKVLIVEDDVAFALMLRTWLSKNGYEAESVVSAEQAVKRMGECVFDVVLSDLRLPDRDGITLLEWIRHKSPHSEVIIMTGYANVSTAVAAIKLGAFDYLEKPVNPEILREKMTAAVTRHEQRRSRPETQSASEPGTAIVWGHSEASAKLRDHLLLVAPTNMSVLITGESGTGKEYAARFIHANSKRKARPFVALDCGVLSRELAASELFGHAKGAFTSAVSDKKGVFETAEGGTVFLDEIGNLPYDVQVQLLRAIQERVIRPVGSVRETAVDVRIIAATNENLLEAIRENKFRGDLFHRLDEFTVQIPPLRERKEDIPAFAESFLQDANRELEKQVEGFDAETAAWMNRYKWPGNLRQMRNAIKRAVLFCKGRIVTIADLPEELTADAESMPEPPASPLLRKVNEKEQILDALRRARNNKSEAARLLEIDRKTLYNKLKLYGIEL